MLPGGLQVIGVFALAPPQMIQSSQAKLRQVLHGPRQANLVLIAYASSECLGEPAHRRSLARTFAARSYKQ